MKACKFCIKEIDNAASKCPYCQSFQVWYKNPQLLGLAFPLVFIPFLFYTMGIGFTKSYIGNENQFDIKVLSASQGEFNRLSLNFLIENKSSKKWSDLSYEVSAFDSTGKLLFVKSGREYSWLVQPKQSSHLTVELNNSAKVEKWSLRILDIKPERF